VSKQRRPASSFGAPEASPTEDPGDSGLPLGPPATNGALVVGPATPAKRAKLALLALARRIFPAPGDAELRASALEVARATQAGAPAGEPVAPETPSEDPAPSPGDAGARSSPTITSDWAPPDGSTEPGEPAPFVAALMDGEVAAEVVDAVKIYGYGETAVYALAGVSVSFGKAHFTAIMGPSGSGKSTLMHCLAGLDRLTQGTVLIGDADLSTLSDKALTQLRRDRVGFIFQQYNLVPTLTAIENITLPLDLAGTRPDAEWLDSVIDTLRIRDRLKHKPDELSGGQQQRVAVARALATRPQIIFADEPTGNLDTRAGAEVLHIMQDSVRQLGQTVVMVTHDPVAAGYADRAIFLMDGRVVSEMYDPTAELVLDEMKTLGG
jgi:putative ABC transport system ATP-binding protein